MTLRPYAASLRNAGRYWKLPTLACCKKLSTDTKAVPSKIYELRIYQSHPQDFKKVVELFQDYIYLRLRHSKVFGFWTAEIGDSISQIVHLWEYDSLSHRLKARKNLVNDEDWRTEFIPKLMPCLQSMTNTLIAPPPGEDINLDFINDPGAVYELQTVERVLGKAELKKSGSDEEILVGRFFGILGPTKTEYRLWRYPNIDASYAASWKRALGSPEGGNSLLLYPASFSPIQ